MVVNHVSFTGYSASRVLRIVLVRRFFCLQLLDGLLLFGHGQLEFAFDCVRNGLLRKFHRPLPVAVTGVGAGSQKPGGCVEDVRGGPSASVLSIAAAASRHSGLINKYNVPILFGASNVTRQVRCTHTCSRCLSLARGLAERAGSRLRLRIRCWFC
jgi:hypothetical protein